MISRVARWARWVLVVAALPTIGGCPLQMTQFPMTTADSDQSGRPSATAVPNATILHALPADMTALLNAPPVEAPTEGATALANTSWSGTQDCVLRGDISMLLSGPGTYPFSDSMYFDERGVPSGVTGYPWQFKRATFTDSSFHVACTFVMSVSMDEPASAGYVVTLSGRCSADGRTLTGRRRIGVIYSFGGPAADLAVTQDCTFTMSRDE